MIFFLSFKVSLMLQYYIDIAILYWWKPLFAGISKQHSLMPQCIQILEQQNQHDCAAKLIYSPEKVDHLFYFFGVFFLRPPNFLSLLHVVQGKRWRFSRNSTKSYGCLGTWRRTTFSNHQWMQASKSSYAEARRGCFEQKRFLLHCCRLQCLIRLIYSTVCTHDWQSFFCRNDFILSKPSNRADSFWLKKPNTYLHYEAALTHCTILCIYTSRLIRGNL